LKRRRRRERFRRVIYLLRDFAVEHPEGATILAAIV